MNNRFYFILIAIVLSCSQVFGKTYSKQELKRALKNKSVLELGISDQTQYIVSKAKKYDILSVLTPSRIGDRAMLYERIKKLMDLHQNLSSLLVYIDNKKVNDRFFTVLEELGNTRKYDAVLITDSIWQEDSIFLSCQKKFKGAVLYKLKVNNRFQIL